MTSNIATEDIIIIHSLFTILQVVGASVAGPKYPGAFAAGLRLGMQWTGLPFIIAGSLFVLAFILLLFVRETSGQAEQRE